MISFYQISREKYYNLQRNESKGILHEISKMTSPAAIYKNRSYGYERVYINRIMEKFLHGEGREELIDSKIKHELKQLNFVSTISFVFSEKKYQGVLMPYNQKENVIFLLIEKQNMIKSTEDIFAIFTNREKEISNLLIEGCTIKYISYHLKIAEGTVKKTISNIYSKMNVGSRVDFMRKILGI